MNVEEAEQIISTAVGLYESQRVPPKKRRKKFVNAIPQVLRSASEVKARPSFRIPEDLQANESKLPELDEKFSVPYHKPEKMSGFLAQEKKFTVRSEYKGVMQNEKNDTDALLKMRNPEAFVERVYELFSGGNLTGKIAAALRKRVEKLPTREAEEAARKAAEAAERRKQEERAAKEALVRAQERAVKFYNAHIWLAILSAFVSVIAVIGAFAGGPIIFGESSGKAVIFLFCVACALFAAASVCAVLARKGTRKPFLSERSLVSLALVIAATLTFFPALTSGRKSLWFGVFIPLGIVWVAVQYGIAQRKRSKDRHQLAELFLYAVCVLACVAFGVNGFPASDFDGHDGIYYYNELPDGTLSVTLSTCYESVVVPASIKGKTVSELDFSPRTTNEKRLKELVLPKTLLRVSSPNIFSDCKNLKALSARASIIQNVGVGNLKELTIFGDTIPKDVCRQAPELRRVSLPDAQTVEEQAFLSCLKLEEIEATTRLQVIGDVAFANCVSLQKVQLPPDVQVGKAAFMRCKGLKAVVIPPGVKLESGVFRECEGIEYASMSAEHISEIAQDNLISVEITGGVEIPERAFFTCRTLTTVSVAESVTSLGERAFQGCRSLQNVRLPDTVSTLGKYCFAGCSSLESFSVPESVTELPGWLFEWNRNLKTVKIPSGLARVGEAAFWGCESLQMSMLHNGVTEIGKGAFAHCKAITNFSLPLFVTAIEELTFAYCDNLESVWLCANVERVESQAFTGCDALNKVTYSGTESEWGEMFVGSENEPFVNAQRTYLKN